MRIAMSIVGVILALFGVLWILQGTSVLPGSPITIKWAVIGGLVLVVALLILVSANRKQA
jgi:hypothetical protein